MPPLALSVNYMVKCDQVGEQSWMQIDKILTEIERPISGGLKTSLMFFPSIGHFLHFPIKNLDKSGNISLMSMHKDIKLCM